MTYTNGLLTGRAGMTAVRTQNNLARRTAESRTKPADIFLADTALGKLIRTMQSVVRAEVNFRYFFPALRTLGINERFP